VSHSVTSGNLPPQAAEALDVSFSEDMLAKLRRYFAELGDAFRIHSPLTGTDIYVFNHPDHVRHVLVDHHQNYTKGIGIERVGILLGNGIMVSEGNLWRRQRKLIQPAFHASVITAMSGHIRDATLQLRERWLRHAQSGTPVNLTQDMSDVTLQIVLRAIFSSDLDAMTAAQGGNPFAILTEDSERNLMFAYKFRALSKIILDCVHRRTAHGATTPDLLAMLMTARDRKTGTPMPEKQLLDEVMTLIVAGHETTASALNWMWYLLSQHPGVESELHREIDTLPEEPDFDQMTGVALTRQIIEETLRLYPPGWLLTRRTIAADTIGNYPIAADTDVFISPYLVHRHPQFWDNPEQFDPDRFSSARRQHNRFAYLPFALGPRACIGEHFAMFEMVMHVVLLARRLRLRYLPQQPIELECQVNLRTKYPLMMRPELRS